MKILSLLMLGMVACVVSLPGQFVAPGIYNTTLVVTSGTPIRVTTNHILITTLSVQMQHGASVGLGYVCIFKTTPASKCSGTGQLAFELTAATASAPGAQLGYPVSTVTPFDLSTVWIDGDTSGAGVIVSYNVK